MATSVFDPLAVETIVFSDDRADRVLHADAALSRLHDSRNSFRFLRQLGRGAMGKVYLAEVRLTGERRAIKFGRRQESTLRAELVQTLQRNRHANVISLDRVTVWSHRPITIVQHIDDMTLLDLVEVEHPLSMEQVVALGQQAAQALSHVHYLGWLHRDVQPRNLLVDRTVLVKLIDFDLAIPLGHPSSSDALAGTPDYLAPEQLDAHAQLTDRADVYSLGCTLFHLLIGRPPFGTPDATSLARVFAHAVRPVPSVTAWRADVPVEFAELIESTLRKSPTDRPSALEVAQRLRFMTGQESGPPDVAWHTIGESAQVLAGV